jgi:hypothetical protein
MGWKCYEHMSLWSGFVYNKWENFNPALNRETPSGDVTTVDVGMFHSVSSDIVSRVRQRKQAAASAIAAAAAAGKPV